MTQLESISRQISRKPTENVNEAEIILHGYDNKGVFLFDFKDWLTVIK